MGCGGRAVVSTNNRDGRAGDGLNPDLLTVHKEDVAGLPICGGGNGGRGRNRVGESVGNGIGAVGVGVVQPRVGVVVVVHEIELRHIRAEIGIRHDVVGFHHQDTVSHHPFVRDGVIVQGY